ncbi:MAG: hypothetical protein QXY12_07115 [Pyrobaculum sp.]
MYRYLAIDAGIRYGTCVKLDGSRGFTIYAVAVAAVTERGLLDVLTDHGITSIDRQSFVEYVRGLEAAMFEKHLDAAETCIVDGTAAPPCRRVINVAKAPADGAVVTPWGYVRGAEPAEVRNVVALNGLAHKYAYELAAVLWRRVQQAYACSTPYGAHPALEYSLFV